MTFPFRYHRLGYVALSVTDLNRSVDFYVSVVGLDLVKATESTAYLRSGGAEHHSIVLYQASVPGLRRVGFQVQDEIELEKARDHFKGLALEPRELTRAEAAELMQGSTFRVREPNSELEIELYSEITTLARPWVPTLAKITRLGHVVIGSSKFQESLKTYVEDFGFAVSDYVEDKFSFLRCFPNPLHHTFAVGASPVNCLHHVNFMVSDIDDIGQAMYRLKKHNVKVAFGPGRHPPSGSIFLYFYDPDGITLEYSFGMEEFPEVGARRARMLEPVPGSLDTWGATPDAEFAKGPRIEVGNGS